MFTLKRCTNCKCEKSISQYYYNRCNKRYYARCKKCLYDIYHNTKYKKDAVKRYSKTIKGKTSLNKAARKAYTNHKEKWVARAKARYAIKKGLIAKPQKCEVCDKIKPLQGHHEDYTKPLEVIFLCYSCHAEADKVLESKFFKKI